MIKFHNLCLCIFLLLCCASTASGQTDGLGFFSHEVIQDKRTGLELGTGKSICFDGSFELSFDIAFVPQQKNYFGYVVRIIQNEEKNIDILYDYDPKFGDKHFRVVLGDSYSHISFSVPGLGKTDDWHTICLKFNHPEGLLTVTRDNESSTEKVSFPEKSCYKVFFGANDYRSFRNADVPPMKIRNVRMKENGALRYTWPLNEEEGNIAAETGDRRPGTVLNPLWIKKMHRNWQPLQHFSVNGPASVAFNKEKGILYLITQDSLFSYPVASNKIIPAAYTNGKQRLYSAYQSVYNPSTKEIYTFSRDLSSLASLRTDSLSWSKYLDNPGRAAGYGHFNKYLQGDSVLYTFNGYGFFIYKNDIFSTRVPVMNTGQRDSTASNITPRYLAAVGADSNGVYMMGGYGNTSGKQVLNPKNLYDFQYYNATTHTFKKLYELRKDSEEFVFANSLVIRKEDQAYYGLIFPKNKFNSALQMIRGSLTSPEFQAVGDKIPFEFQDVDAYADLFHSPADKRFIAVTLYSPDDHSRTTVNIYSLYDPPFPATMPLPHPAGVEPAWWMAIALITVLTLLVSGLARLQKRNVIRSTGAPQATPAQFTAATEIVFTGQQRQQNAIYLFGDFQVFDSTGTEVTKLFTPLIKELFLIILLYTVKWERGISAEKLKELLWFDKSPESARNNLAVNIAKLKSILDKIDGCEISKDTGYWKIRATEQLYVDYMAYLAGARQTAPGRADMTDMAGIIQRGSFLPTEEHEWLDPFKSDISNDITDRFLQFATTTDIKEDPAYLVRIADYLYAFDPVNEDVMRWKCKALVILGKHSLARAAFENFVRDYRKLYGEEYQPDFQQTIS
ncbi:galactose oxidase [Chitinophaga arvensicola]|uniref:DNA-binding transcriptional activator of the SARP family n=1 Tax=Chitinophaga arvensicola TaxID=29529 RepID=A0A1I0SBI0_9BACT|nr:galactose oxidase [Chitinophaga arvensicola]SEW53970.1 DNA-binding transcriptional activator of the SARP family [Chitinophaga arvensicola]